MRIGLVFLAVAAGALLIGGMLWLAAPVRAAPVWAAQAGRVTENGLATPTPLPNHPAVESPDITFIDSPTAACILPRSGTDACYITWNYMYVDANPAYMISMTVAIDGRMRGNYQGFFQTSMYVPQEMLAFRVACGRAGSGGNASLGMIHSYTLRARDSNGLGSANYGSVTCPADQKHRVYMPYQHKR